MYNVRTFYIVHIKCPSSYYTIYQGKYETFSVFRKTYNIRADWNLYNIKIENSVVPTNLVKNLEKNVFYWINDWIFVLFM